MAALNDGKYRAKAKDWAVGNASTGTPQVGVVFEFLDHPGEERTWYGFLSDAALKTTVKALRACGWEGADLDMITGLDKNEVIAVLESEEYQGEVQQRIRWINSQGGLAMNNQLVGRELQDFSKAMKAKILALDPGSAAKHAAAKPTPKQKALPTATASAPANGGKISDDIPF
jgi:hypothetical protein